MGFVWHDQSRNAHTTSTFDVAALAESDRVAFAAALFALAAVDGTLDRTELSLIFEILDLDGLSPAAQQAIQQDLLHPPTLEDVFTRLATADETLRYGLMVLLVDIAWADDVLAPEEERGLAAAQQQLGVSDAQMQAIQAFTQKLRAVRARGLDDSYAADAVKGAVAGLTAVGVPITAIYFSGSVVGLSAAGITSGLAALGLGGLLGLSAMVTGIGAIVVVGAGLFIGISHLLDTGGRQARDRYRAQQEKKVQRVIANLHMMINWLLAQIQTLQEDTAANREAIDVINDRLRKLQGILNQRQAAAGSAG